MDGIADFSQGHYGDQFDPSSPLTNEHQAGLEHEVEGSRWHIQAYYLPKIEAAEHKAGPGRPLKRILECGCGNGWSVGNSKKGNPASARPGMRTTD